MKKLDKIDGTRKKDGGGSQEKQQSKREDNPLATNRAGRDYTNLRFQDPRFYECPKLLETAPSTTNTTTTTSTSPKQQEIDLKEVLKRSESLSPRHEKDWEQLSSRFSSEENIIDIDKLSINTLARSEKSDKFDKEKHPSQFGQQKELTLSGGGTMFLKSNRSRDTTPIHETGKLDEFRISSIPDETNKDSGDKLKSILREKQSEDGKLNSLSRYCRVASNFNDSILGSDDRPVDEERKSVRFDIEKEVDIKYTYSRSEYESESESDEQEVLAMLSNRDTEWSPSAQKIGQRFTGEESKNDPEDKIDGCIKKSLSSERIEASKAQNGKIVGKRFVVRNVPENELRKKFAPQNASEKEHRMQMTRDSLSGESLSRESSLDYTFTNKFNKIKNIDLVSKSETDYSDSELRRKNKLRVEFPRNEQTDDDETSDFSKINQETRDISRKEANEATKQQDQSKKLEETKAKLSQEHEKDIEALRKEYKDKLEQMKKELEENFAEQKKQIEKNLSDKLEDMRRKMVEKVFFLHL